LQAWFRKLIGVDVALQDAATLIEQYNRDRLMDVAGTKAAANQLQQDYTTMGSAIDIALRRLYGSLSAIEGRLDILRKQVVQLKGSPFEPEDQKTPEPEMTGEAKVVDELEFPELQPIEFKLPPDEG